MSSSLTHHAIKRFRARKENTVEIGKPGRRMKRYCGARVSSKFTKRGTRFVVSHPDTKMVRFISEADYRAALAAPEICAYLPEPFAKK